MLTFRKVLFPVDLSPRCVAIAPYVAAIAHSLKRNSFCCMLCRVQDLPYDSILPLNVYTAYEDAIREQRTTELGNLGRKAFEGLTVTRLVEAGLAADRRRPMCGRHEIDLIVMPTHGYGRFRRFLLGCRRSRKCSTMLYARFGPRYIRRNWWSLLLKTSATSSVPSILVRMPYRVIRAARDIASRYGCGGVPCSRRPRAPTWTWSDRRPAVRRFCFRHGKGANNCPATRSAIGLFRLVLTMEVWAAIRDTALGCDAQLVVIGRGRFRKSWATSGPTFMRSFASLRALF